MTASPPARSSARTRRRHRGRASAPPSATSSAWASRPSAVPDLSGPAADAEDTLADAGLTVGAVERGLQRQRRRRRGHQPGPGRGHRGRRSAPPSATSSAWASSPSRCPISPAPPPMPRTPSPPPASPSATRARPSVTASPPARSSARTPPRAPRSSVGSTVSYVISLGVETGRPCPTSPAPPPMPRTRSPPPASRRRRRARPSATASPPARSSARTRPRAPRSTLGSTVSYVVSLGVETVAVPDLSGPAADAEDTLAAAGLTVGDVERGLQRQRRRRRGHQPGPRRGHRGRRRLDRQLRHQPGRRDSRPCPTSPAPPPTPRTRSPTPGLTVGDAERAFSDSVAAGEVISQDPAAGTEVDVGSTVNYVVSLGVEQSPCPISPAPPPMPRTRSPPPASPSATPSEAFSDSVAAGEVIGQDPAAGTEVDVGSTVSYVISLGVEQVVAVPDLSGPPPMPRTRSPPPASVGAVERGLQ